MAGHAFAAAHDLYAPGTTFSSLAVHIDAAAAIAGVSRFGERHRRASEVRLGSLTVGCAMMGLSQYASAPHVYLSETPLFRSISPTHICFPMI